ncbi:DUF763 domain-containing protein [Thermoplasma sp.]|uniref:DUF763 domain-containing protein n=1 Tax=Thermoplasma sp. TaxID=1973142 RepID=UPI00127CBBF5|nr:DUF763 domain-containing protein [Thermoplasma sp.]KAA8922961.1 MAG: DUF763 domain-containing protein [Thermoplasma sp.]
MERRGISTLPLHYGHPPEYLFRRAIKLSGIMAEIIMDTYGQDELIRRLADPFWFHSLSLVTGFDWNSSGTTVFTLSALKEYLSGKDLGVMVCGGKAGAMAQMKDDLLQSEESGVIGENEVQKVYENARRIAKIDNSLLQDGYDLYMQFVVVSSRGRHAVIQQGMNSEERMARRYHWLIGDDRVDIEGRYGLSSERTSNNVLDLSAVDSRENRYGMLASVREGEIWRFRSGLQSTLDNFSMPFLDLSDRVNWQKLRDLYEYGVDDFEKIYMEKGIGRSTLRALSYIAEVIYGSKASFKDPVKFSFALGGKDGIPKPVNTYDYDRAIEFFSDLLKEKELNIRERENIARSLSRLSQMRTNF